MIGPSTMELPTGTVTFLFTDVEGSTRLLQRLGDGYRAVQDAHARIMRRAIKAGGGVSLSTEGDSFFAVFADHAAAVRAAVAAQRSLAAHPWPVDAPVRVRMGLHTGRGELGGDNYLGIDVNRAARIAAAGHGGQVLLSDATRALVQHELPDGVGDLDLGEHGLRDFEFPVHIYQLHIEGLLSQFPPLKTLEVPSTLPSPLTSFVGRESEVHRVAALVRSHRLVTLIGPGGTGKTRLAVEVARRFVDTFRDGNFFVDLSPIMDAQLIPDSIASALRLVPERSGRPVLEILKEHLRDRTALLVIDNFEQVRAGADTVAVLLSAAPRIRALVTSRAPLSLSGEQTFPVPPMGIADATDGVAALRRSEAVSLFVDRATAVDPSFSLADDEVEIVAEICSRLDGLPLAIELAASRVRILPPRQLLERLEPIIPMLIGGPHDAPERQQTLEATIRWSHHLLNDAARLLFRQLSVFSGGWTLDAMEEVADRGTGQGDLLSVLDALVQHSLVHRLPDAQGRLGMLQTIRAFALAQLDASEDGPDIRKRHAGWFRDLAERAGPHLTGPEQRRWLDELSREHDNLRAALRWAIDAEESGIALRTAGALWRFWYARGHLEEGRRWLEAALGLPSSPEPTTPQARALTALGGIAYWQGDFDAALSSYEEALEIHRALGDRGAMVQALLDVGETRAVKGDPGSGVRLMTEGLALARELGDRRGEAWAIWGLASARMFAGELEAARDHLERSLRIFEEVGDDTWGWGNALGGLAGLAAMRGDPKEARRMTVEGFALYGEQTNAVIITGHLRNLSLVANLSGQYERAARLAGAEAAWRRKLGFQIPGAFDVFEDPGKAAARQLSDEAFQRAWTAGQSMSLEEALAFGMGDA
jgi:predicted ATPase/class 3 adenylate cyclase